MTDSTASTSFPSPAPGAAKSRWVWPLVVGAVGFALVYPFDGPLNAAFTRMAAGLGGDIKRELAAWQQYGQGTAIAVSALLIWLLDPARRRRLLDLLLAVVIAQIVSQGAKMLIGRPRPRPQFDDPRTILGPWGEYRILVSNEWRSVHAWDIRAGANTDLWSMPSSHTLFAAVLTVFLATLYPRIRWVVFALLAVVGLGRILFDAHWPSDVIVGVAIGWAIGAWVVGGMVGCRVFSRFTKPENPQRRG